MTSLMAFFIVFIEMTLISCVCLDDLFPVVLRLSHLGMKKERHCQYRVLDPCAVPPPPPPFDHVIAGLEKNLNNN